MRFFGFRGGVHPPENKLQTENMPVEKLAAHRITTRSNSSNWR